MTIRKRARSGGQARFTAGDRRQAHVPFGGHRPAVKKRYRRQDGPLVQAVEAMLNEEARKSQDGQD